MAQKQTNKSMCLLHAFVKKKKFVFKTKAMV